MLLNFKKVFSQSSQRGHSDSPVSVGTQMRASRQDTEFTSWGHARPKKKDPPKNCAYPDAAPPQNFPIL